MKTASDRLLTKIKESAVSGTKIPIPFSLPDVVKEILQITKDLERRLEALEKSSEKK